MLTFYRVIISGMIFPRLCISNSVDKKTTCVETVWLPGYYHAPAMATNGRPPSRPPPPAMRPPLPRGPNPFGNKIIFDMFSSEMTLVAQVPRPPVRPPRWPRPRCPPARPGRGSCLCRPRPCRPRPPGPGPCSCGPRRRWARTRSSSSGRPS